ncbi:MAG: phosphatase PAP2 family protein [Clostridiales bacterium]|nr:phosphatase PAP2 family protein [bacterium 210917-SL.2.15]MCI5842238.1 phosphatase PAP2 family protein [Clostridiales bacterium]MDY4037394.1 phosphatase PAP2 family protein [Candidatus Pseudoscilispira sp.]
MEFMILDAIQTLRTPWLDGVMVFVSSLGNSGAVWIVLAAVLLALPKYRRLGVVVACALALDLVVCNLFLKPLIARPRPCDMNTAMDYLIARPHGWSFPSGHTAASFAAASALWFGGSRLWIPCGILAVLIALSRLYLYVHFPTDVLGGAAVGILCGALGAFAVRRVAVRRDGT